MKVKQQGLICTCKWDKTLFKPKIANEAKWKLAS